MRKPGEVTVWDVASYKKKASIRGHARAVYSVSISPHAMLLATASADDTIKLRPLASLLSRK